jgi:DNA helicase-4
MRMHGGSQAEMIESAPEEIRAVFQAGQADGAAAESLENGAERRKCRRFSGLIHQAINILDKGRFVSPWKHILVDEFQDISPSAPRCLQRYGRKIKHVAVCRGR